MAVVLALVSSLLSSMATPANAVPANPPCITKTTRVGNETVVQFLRTGTCAWTLPADVVQLRGLIVGGGGGGGGGGLMGGGGGGGGYVEFNSLAVTSQSMTITVGAGGSRDPNGSTGASNGGESSLESNDLTLIAEGGGAGGTFTSTYLFFPPPIEPKNGGSGGGSNALGYGTRSNPLPIVEGQEINPESHIAIGLLLKGNDGSAACESDLNKPFASGGGGGAGGPATCAIATKNGQSSFSGNGGIGFQNNILGVNYHWAGGGGGANFVYSDQSDQPVFNGGNGGLGGGGGGGASDQQLEHQERSAGVDDTYGLNPATRVENAGAGIGGNGGANTGGGGGAGSHGGGGGLGGNGGSGIVVLRYSTPQGTPDPSSDATLNSATMKGVEVTNLGTGSATIGSVIAGSVTLPDSVLAGSSTTAFNLSVPNIPGVPEAIVKAVLLTPTDSIEEDFNSGQDYNGETITPGSFFVVKVTSQDGTATKYYRINITITDLTAPIISITPPSPVYFYESLGYIAQDETSEYLTELPTATATDNIDGALPAPTLTYAANGSYGCDLVNNLATVKTCLNYVGSYVDFIFTAQDVAGNVATQTIRIKSVPGDNPVLAYREPITKGDIEPEIRLDISGLYQYRGISYNYTENETVDGWFSSQEFGIDTFDTGLSVKRINSTDDGDVHIFFYGPATQPGRVTVRAYAPAFLHSFPEEDSNLLSIPIICDGNTVACEVGDTGPGGGTIFYVEPDSDGFASEALECIAGCRYLEAAATSGSNIWYDLGLEEEGFMWSGNTTYYALITDIEIGAGYKNTLDMIGIVGAGTVGAASAARDYQGGGKNDWYLPSLTELERLHLSNVANINDAYWSSSEDSCSNEISNECGRKAQASGGENGAFESGSNNKETPLKVRPIRAFGAIASNEVSIPCGSGGSFTVVGSIVQSSSTNPWCAGSVVIPSGVTEIRDGAFGGANQITTLTISDSVETIGVGAFNSLSSLVSLTLGNGLRTIGDNAFSGTSSLTSLIIPDGVRFIGAYAFEEDFRLETLRIPSTVESIGAGAFDGTSALRSFQYCGTAAQRENLHFGNAGLGRKEILPCPSDPTPPTTPPSTTQAPATSAAISPVLTNKSMKLKVSFSERSSRLSAKEKKKLLRVVANVGSKVTGGKVIGYVQLDGNSSNDRKLSTARARAVSKFLADNGIKVRIVTKGKGALNNKESSRRANITLRYAE